MFEKDIRTLARKIKKSGIKYTHVTPVVRGGLVPAVRLSHLLDIPLLMQENPASLRGYCLGVDELVDNGNTLQHLHDEFILNDVIFSTAVLYRKDWTSYEPDYYVRTINKYIIFPWEEK